MDIKGNLKVEGQLNVSQLDNEKVVITDNQGNVKESITTSVEIEYVSGVTSPIQAQLDDKANTTLSNLVSPTAINQDLLPQIANTFNLGNSGLEWDSASINKVNTEAVADSLGNVILDTTTTSLNDNVGNQAIKWNTTNATILKTLSLNNNSISDVVDPVNPQDVVTKNYSDNITNGLANKTLSNLTAPTAINQNLLPDGPGRVIGDFGNEFNSVFTESIVTDAMYDSALSPRILVSSDETIITSKNNAPIILNPDGTGNISVSNSQIADVVDPTSPQHAATKNYVDNGLSNKIDLTEKGAPLGVATLDGAGKVPLTQLPAAIMTYEGVWNASTNSPTLADGVGDAGMVYRVGTAGTQDLGSGPITFDVGDYVIYNGTVWEKSDTTDAVASVNGFTGIVTLDTDDVPEGATNLYYTDARVLAALPQDIATTATPQFQDVQVIGTGLGNRLVGKTLALASSTGVISGFTLSINGGDASKFDIAAGVGEIVDVTNPSAPVVIPVNFAGQTAVTVTDLLTAPVTYVSVDSSGNIYQQTTVPTPVERRQRMFIGRLNHSNNTTITFANTYPDFKLSFISQYYDLLDALAPFKIGGLSISANGANLSFNRSSGSAFFRSNNYTTNPSNPHTTTFTASTPQSFRKFTQTTTVDAVNVNVIDPANYDVGGVVTPIPGGGGTSTIQRIYLFKSGEVRVAYGQNTYGNLADALAAINTDSFIPNTTIDQSAILVGYIVVRKDATNLSNTAQARILTAARFDAGGSAVAGGITSLQQAYNNSTLPQIILSSALGAFTVDDNATPLGTDLFQVRNNAGTDHFAVSALNTKVSNTLQIPTGAGTGKVLTSDASGNASWQDAAPSLQDVYDNSAPPAINLTPNGPIEIFDPGVAGGRAFLVATVGGAFEVRDSELSYTGPNVLLNDTSIKGVKNPIEWDNATNRDYVDNRSNTNFILNGTSESGADGWMTYADTAASRPVDGTGGSPTISFLPYAAGPLSGNVSFLLDKPSGNRRGQGVSYDFTIDPASQAKVLKISFDYAVATGTFVAGTNTTDSDVIVYLYDITNARLIEPSSIKLLSNATSPSDTFQSTFQTSPDSVNYRLIFHIATSAGAPWALKIDNVKVERSQYVYGTPITDWQSYTPALSPITGSVTNVSATGRWRRVGDSIELEGAATFSAASAAFTGIRFGLPSGLAIDFTKLTNDSKTTPVGEAFFNDTGLTNYSGLARLGSGFGNFVDVQPTVVTTHTGTVAIPTQDPSNTFPFTFNSTDTIKYRASGIPIQGWSSSVQVSDGYDGRIVAGAAYRVNTNQTGVNPNNSQVKVLINGLGPNNLDTVAGWDFINNRYVVKTSGSYRINAGIELAGTNVLAQTYAGRIVVNGTTSYSFDIVTPAAVTPFALTGSVTINLVAGDYVELFLFGLGNNSVNTLTIQNGNITNLTLEKSQAPTTISMTETVAVIASNSSGQSIPSGPVTTITNWTKTQDTHNAFNATAGTFTAPYPGFYEFSGILTFSNYAATVGVEHYYNVGGTVMGLKVSETTAGTLKEIVGTTTIYLNSGQQVPIATQQNSGSARLLLGNGVLNKIYIKMVK